MPHQGQLSKMLHKNPKNISHLKFIQIVTLLGHFLLFSSVPCRSSQESSDNKNTDDDDDTVIICSALTLADNIMVASFNQCHPLLFESNSF